MPRRERTNLTTLAERLGVSISTVSRALRGMEGIHPETRSRIIALSHQMGYSSKSPAVGPMTSELERDPRHILALSQNTAPQIDQRFMAGISGAAVSYNIAVLTHLVAQNQCDSVLDSRTAPTSFRTGLVKGLILLHRWPSAVARQLCEKLPSVSVVHDYPGTQIDLIGIDERRGINELMEHLYHAGHRRIGFFGLCPEVTWSCGRFAAYVESLTRLDLEYEPANVVRIDLQAALEADPFPVPETGRQVQERIRQQVDAWICASSTTAEALRLHLVEAGLRIPEDVALTSFHGDSRYVANGLPPFTTTDVVDEELGAAAIRRLIGRIDKPFESRRAILVPARLKIGQTTRPVS